MSVALVADPACKLHDAGAGHPEQPGRFDAVLRALEKSGAVARMRKIPSRRAEWDEIERCHTNAYIRVVQRDLAAGRATLSTGDTSLSAGSLEAALLAAGSVMNAVDAVLSGEADRAFCILRPPGHHAGPSRGMGFCLFNNVAVAARHAQDTHGVERILIADWDVHHGNGTQDIFYEDPSVYFFSTHQSPWYPGTGDPNETGEGKGEGTTMNCPFPAGAGRGEILGAFQQRLTTASDAFRPDLVMISAGFDSRINDPLGRFRLSDDDFADLTQLMMEIADKHAGGRLISALEGGYRLDGLASAASAHAHALIGNGG